MGERSGCCATVFCIAYDCFPTREDKFCDFIGKRYRHRYQLPQMIARAVDAIAVSGLDEFQSLDLQPIRKLGVEPSEGIPRAGARGGEIVNTDGHDQEAVKIKLCGVKNSSPSSERRKTASLPCSSGESTIVRKPTLSQRRQSSFCPRSCRR